MKIKVGIVGFGNLGRGVLYAVKNSEDMQLVGVFTRRNPESVKLDVEDVPVYNIDKATSMTNEIDVMILCGGSATDLPQQTAYFAKYFNVVDSFDTHAKIPEHFENVDNISKRSNKTAIISVGWDPGMFSLNRLYANAILPNGKDYTFWGKGVSQGHSDAVRRIDGVLDARQYTIPIESALEAVRSGECPELSARQKHLRQCFVVAKEGADLSKIENEIKNMPNYFSDYDTTVEFITMDEMKKNHSALAHGGFVIRSGKTGIDNKTNHIIEYSLKLESNPEFTGAVLTAYARAAVKMNDEGNFGCKSVFDVAPSYLSDKPVSELIKNLL